MCEHYNSSTNSSKQSKKKLEALIGPSILNADLSNLSIECKSLLDAGADYLVYLHIYIYIIDYC